MALRVTEIKIEPKRHACLVEFSYGHCQKNSSCEHELWIKSENFNLAPTGDGLFMLCLPMALKIGGEIEFDGRTSEGLDRKIDAIVGELSKFGFKYLSLNRSISLIEPDLALTDHKIASFFSGGLDSTFTAETNLVNYLVSVRGFDIEYQNLDLWDAAVKNILKFSKKTKTNPLFLSTNIRHISNPILSWGSVYHGTALGAIAMVLPLGIETTLIPSTSALLASKPGYLGTGSHLCDLLSNFGRNTITDKEQSRLEKIDLLGRMGKEYALRSLRVCWENLDGEYQCGRCFKCILTALEFDYSGLPYRSSSLAEIVNFKDVLGLRPSISQCFFLIEDYRVARKLNLNRNLRRSVKLSLLVICARSFVANYPKRWLKQLLSS